jgi:hypothetical protein
MRSIIGGDIAMIDTENRRGLHYADSFEYQHVDFKPPFGSVDYLDAIRQCHAAGAKIIIVDSLSHEHDGSGGLLESHEAELTRLAGDDYRKREAMKFLAWQKPKAARRAFINGFLQLDAHFVFCFRAKKTIKPVKRDGKTAFEEQGFMPIAGEELPFEATLNVVLPPAGEGTPIWLSEYAGEKMYMKLPMQFKELFAEKKQLDESIGKALAEWAQGGAAPKPKEESVEKSTEAEGFNRKDTLEEIKATFRKNDLAGRSKEETAERNAILRDHFLTDKWSVIQKMEAEKLRDGLDSMQKYFSGEDMPERGEGAEMF